MYKNTTISAGRAEKWLQFWNAPDKTASVFIVNSDAFWP